MSNWITSNPDVLGGKACVRGTRISVEFLLELVGEGASPKDILAAYPQVSEEALRAAFHYAADSMKSEIAWDVKLPA
jgi:uncharacterized protein (DUF433 family)